MSERTRKRQGLFVILVVFLLVIGLIRSHFWDGPEVNARADSEPAPDGTESVSVVLDTLPAFSDNPPAMEEAACSV